MEDSVSYMYCFSLSMDYPGCIALNNTDIDHLFHREVCRQEMLSAQLAQPHMMKSPGAGCFLLFSALCSVSLDPAMQKLTENLQMTVNHQAHHDRVRRKDNVFAPLSFRHEIFP